MSGSSSCKITRHRTPHDGRTERHAGQAYGTKATRRRRIAEINASARYPRRECNAKRSAARPSRAQCAEPGCDFHQHCTARLAWNTSETFLKARYALRRVWVRLSTGSQPHGVSVLCWRGKCRVVRSAIALCDVRCDGVRAPLPHPKTGRGRIRPAHADTFLLSQACFKDKGRQRPSVPHRSCSVA